MRGNRFCKSCGKRFSVKRNPQQIYCSDKRCQHQRKIVWRRVKMKNDADYRANQKAANKRWQSKHSDYWRQYRAKHPEYVSGNRHAQRRRDVTQVKASHLAKSDALTEESLMAPGTYWLTPSDNTLAKSDALLVRIHVLPGQNSNKGILAKRLLYGQ